MNLNKDEFFIRFPSRSQVVSTAVPLLEAFPGFAVVLHVYAGR
jgi:hypothetical protein